MTDPTDTLTEKNVNLNELEKVDHTYLGGTVNGKIGQMRLTRFTNEDETQENYGYSFPEDSELEPNEQMHLMLKLLYKFGKLAEKVKEKEELEKEIEEIDG